MVAAACGAYLALHFVLYATLLRHGRFASTERGIFLYHFVPAAAWTIAAAALAFLLPDVSVAEVFLVAALHGIYSLTFLELWALADGGYSLAILEGLESRKEADERRILDELEQIGATKEQARMADLLRMGLVEERGGEYRLTPSGRVAAAAIAALARLSNAPMSR
jgi:hypothetical protein